MDADEKKPILFVKWLGDEDSKAIFDDLQDWVRVQVDAPLNLVEIEEGEEASTRVCEAIAAWAKENPDAQFVYLLAHGNANCLGDNRGEKLSWDKLGDAIQESCDSIPRDQDDIEQGPSRLSIVFLSCQGAHAVKAFNSRFSGNMPVADVLGVKGKLPFKVVRALVEQTHSELAKLNLNFREAFARSLSSLAPDRQPEMYTLSDDLSQLVPHGPETKRGGAT